jgi:hypothetical protein
MFYGSMFHRKKREIENRSGLVASFPFFKQQVMIGKCRSSHSLIGMEPPTIPLPFLNCLSDILVVTNLHALPFFQLNLTLRNTSEQ